MSRVNMHYIIQTLTFFFLAEKLRYDDRDSIKGTAIIIYTPLSCVCNF